MRKRKVYDRVLFNVPAIERCIEEFNAVVKDSTKTEYDDLSVKIGQEEWSHDEISEFFSDVRQQFKEVHFTINNPTLRLYLTMDRLSEDYIKSAVSVRSINRDNIQRIFSVFDSFAESCRVPEVEKPKQPKPKPKVFIGHGQSLQWRDLKDHLQDQHGYEVIAYEMGSRAGHSIRDVISDMLEKSSFAILVMTGEDKTPDGRLRPRQNVIHETGLFQGRLGFTKAIVLIEEGTEVFSNIAGVQQIRYAKGNIKETFGDVLAVLKREFTIA